MRSISSQQPASVLSILESRWRLITVTIIGGTLLAGVLTEMQPKIYRAEAKLLVRTGRQEMVMGADATPDHSPRPVTEEEVNSEIELLRSQALLQQVVADGQPAGNSPAASNPRANELAVLKLFKHLDVSAVRKTNVIQVSFYGDSPEGAVGVLRDLTSHYFTASLAAHSSPNSYGFFSTQLTDAQQKMTAAEQQLSALREKTQLYSTPEQKTALVKTLTDTRDQLHETEVKLSELRSRAAALEAERDHLPSRTSTQERTAVNLQLVERLESSLNELRTSRIALLAKYKPNDALVQILDKQIASTEAELAVDRQMGPAERSTDVNPVYQAALQQLEENTVESDGLHARQRVLKAIEADTLAQLGRLDSDAVRLADLDRKQQDAQDNYVLYSKRLEEARISHQMDQDRIANVAVIEAPLASPIPVGPSLPLNLVIGLGGGALLGFCLGWLLETAVGNRLFSRTRRNRYVMANLSSSEVSA